MEPIKVKTIEYRGISAPIYLDDDGQQFYTILDGESIGFGSFNTSFDEDLKCIIDKRLDFICKFCKYPGASLDWFFNGVNGDRDIKLSYRTRILKVFIVANETSVISSDYKLIKEESEEILKKYTQAVK